MNNNITPKQIRQQYRTNPGEYFENEIQEMMTFALESNAKEWAKRGGKPEEIYNMLWVLVEECGTPYFVTQMECRQIAAKSFRDFLREQQEFVKGATFESQYGPNNITADIKAMERDMLRNRQYFKFGIDLLDEALGGGVEKAHVLSIIGNPGSMKTSLLLNGIEHWVASYDDPVMFFSLDMEKNEIYRRLLLRKIGCGKKELQQMIATQHPTYIEACKEIAQKYTGKLTIHDNATHKWTLDEMLDQIRIWTPGLVCIDFLTQLTVDKARSDYDIVRQTAPALKDIAHAYGCAVIEISQMSQASRNIQATGGMGGSAKGGPVVEENCDHELELFKDMASNPDEGMTVSNIVATIKKTRGPSGGCSFQLDYDGPQMRFKSTASKIARQKEMKPIFAKRI